MLDNILLYLDIALRLLDLVERLAPRATRLLVRASKVKIPRPFVLGGTAVAGAVLTWAVMFCAGLLAPDLAADRFVAMVEQQRYKQGSGLLTGYPTLPSTIATSVATSVQQSAP